MRILHAILLIAVGVAGCGRQPQPSQPQAVATESRPLAPMSSAEPSAPTVDPATVGTIAGTVFFRGDPPPRKEVRVQGNPECSALHRGPVYDEEVLVTDGHLQNVFVYISGGLEGRTFAPPATPATIDQVGCLYVPHVVGAQVNQPVLFLNSDPTLHNIHSYAKNSRGWNFGLPFQGMKQTKEIPAPEVMIQLKCDVHPWMVGYLGVVPHPYYAVTGADGRFLLKDVPPGTYTIEAWHERFGVQRVQAQVTATQTTDLSVTFSAQ